MKPAKVLLGWAEFLQPYWHNETDKFKIAKHLQRPMRANEVNYLALINKYLLRWIKEMLSDTEYWAPSDDRADQFTLQVGRDQAETEVSVPLTKALEVLAKGPLKKMCSFKFDVSSFQKRMRAVSSDSRKAIEAWLTGAFIAPSLYVWLQGNDSRIEKLYEDYEGDAGQYGGWEAVKSGKSQYEAEVRDAWITNNSVVFDMDLGIFGWELVYRNYKEEAAEARGEAQMEERWLREQGRLASRVANRFLAKMETK